MVFSPCCLVEGFSEVIPVTVVTSFPHRLVITVMIGKLAGDASRASAVQRATEVEQALQHDGPAQDTNIRTPAD